jgi:hypothetical protein
LFWLATNGLLLVGAVALVAIYGSSLVRWLTIMTLFANFMVHFLLLRARARAPDRKP